MADGNRSDRRLHRLPRPVYWAAGAAVAFTGALGARLIAEGAASAQQQVVIWLGGATVIFVGLAISSLGTRWRLEAEQTDEERGEGDDRPQAGDRGAGKP